MGHASARVVETCCFVQQPATHNIVLEPPTMSAVSTAAAQIPGPDLDGPKFLSKYELEKQKRIRPEADAQYIELRNDENLSQFLDDPWLASGTPVQQVVPDGGSCKFFVIGAGFGAILFAVKLVQQGYRASEICFVDTAGGFGGTWYWNRLVVKWESILDRG